MNAFTETLTFPPPPKFFEDFFSPNGLTKRRKPSPPIQEYVVGFAFNEDATKVVLIRKNKPTWQAGKLNGVGGKVEPDEIPEDAMQREFLEETGVLTYLDDWQNFLTIRGDGFVLHCFRAFLDISGVRTVEREVVEVVDTYPLPRDTIPNLQWIVPLALDNIEPFTVFDGGPYSRLGDVIGGN